MHIDLILDVVCPWCYVGKKQLDKALELRPSALVEISIRPYQLSPDTPAEGVDRAAYYQRKFPDTAQLSAAREHLQTLAKALGIGFDFESDCRIANTMDAHRLILWARSSGLQSIVADRLMKAYFEDCAFLGDHALLTEIAGASGMDAGLVADLLATEKDIDTVAAAVSEARGMGVQGVPTYIFDGKAAISGAQGTENFVRAIDHFTGVGA